MSILFLAALKSLPTRCHLYGESPDMIWEYLRTLTSAAIGTRDLECPCKIIPKFQVKLSNLSTPARHRRSPVIALKLPRASRCCNLCLVTVHRYLSIVAQPFTTPPPPQQKKTFPLWSACPARSLLPIPPSPAHCSSQTSSFPVDGRKTGRKVFLSLSQPCPEEIGGSRGSMVKTCDSVSSHQCLPLVHSRDDTLIHIDRSLREKISRSPMSGYREMMGHTV